MGGLLFRLAGLAPGLQSAVIGAGAVVLVALGAAGALFWENRTPWGLEAKRAELERAIETPETGWRDSYRAAEDGRLQWMAATDLCETQREKEQSEAADAVTRASEQRATAASAAFNQGYAAGRAVGLQQCGATPNAPEDDLGRPGGLPGPVGLRDGQTDLSALFGAGAYRPGGDPPGLPGGAERR